MVYKQSAALVTHLQQLQQRQAQLASQTPPVRSAHGRGKDRRGRSSAARDVEVEERQDHAQREATQAALEAARGTARELSALVRAALAINTLAWVGSCAWRPLCPTPHVRAQSRCTP